MKLVFLGPPGAGKGTLAVMAAARIGLAHISTGDLFRAAIKAGTPLGLQVRDILSAGKLVPDELTIGIVRERLAKDDARAGWILDGFPRTVTQAVALQEFEPVGSVVNFEVDDPLILSRILGRQVCRGCGKIYHVVTMPSRVKGVCDACGGEVYTRPDDSEQTVRARLAEYRANTAPLIEWYGERKLLLTIDGSGTPEEVYARFAGAVGL